MGEDRRALPHTLSRATRSCKRIHLTCYIPSRVCTHSQHSSRSHTQWVLTCNVLSHATRTQHALIQHPPPRHIPLHVRTCLNACSHTHTLLHIRSSSHVHTHRCTDAHEVMNPGASPRSSHTSTLRKKKTCRTTEKHTQIHTQPHP